MSVKLKGIDVSKHNGTIDWSKVSKEVDFAILRAGYGKVTGQKDIKFEYNYEQAKKYGVPIGAYHYSYATSVAEAQQEADVLLQWLEGKKFEFPIYFDIEEKKQAALPKATCTAMVNAFCKKLEAAGYWVGVYSYDSFFTSNLDSSIQTAYACWVARVENVQPTYCKKYGIWQYSWKGSVSGIVGDVDMNYCYIDYPTAIKKAKLNGYKDKLYTVTGVQEHVNEAKAEALCSQLKNIGMTALMKEDE